MDKTVHFLVAGRVQGVFFRARTKSTADKYGVTGWVQNRPDGRVEGRATGSEDSLRHFTVWLHHGPELARVDHVEILESAREQFNGFRIR